MAKARTTPVRVGWMANTLEQVQQAHTALDSFPEMKPHIDVVIACAAANTDWSDRDVLIVDEAGHAPATQWRAQIETCNGARWAFTATPDSDDEQRNADLRSLFGNEEYVIRRSAVANKLAPAKVVMLDDTDPGLRERIDREITRRMNDMVRRYGSWLRTQNYDAVARRILGEHNKPAVGSLQWCIKDAGLEEELNAKMDDTIRGILWPRIAWQVCIDLGIVANRARNDAAVRMALKHKDDHVLVLVNQIEHGKEIADRIPGAMMAFSKMGKKKRAAAVEGFRDGTVKCVVGTSMFDEGADFPIANVLILVSGGRSKSKTEQRSGRVLRTFRDKPHGTIYDFDDTFHPLTQKHSLHRQSVYDKLGYEFVTKRGVEARSICQLPVRGV